MSISTHVLDAVTGRPAAGVGVRLECHGDGGWQLVANGVTDADAPLRHWGLTPSAVVHRLIFHTTGHSDFYPEVVITFAVADPREHYHVPLLLSPFAYSTYRGS